MAVKIPAISLAPTESIDDLRRSVEQSVNHTIELVNRETVIGPLSMNGNRITDMRKGVRSNDAVTLKQLKDNVGGISRRFPPSGGGTRYLKLTFELNEPFTVSNNVTPHLELPIRSNETATAIEAYLNLKNVGGASFTVDIKASIDYGTATPATRTWTSLNTGGFTLTATLDQIYPPSTTFTNPGPFSQGAKYRCDILAASGSVGVCVVVFKIDGT
jgi:hypothetical protein